MEDFGLFILTVGVAFALLHMFSSNKSSIKDWAEENSTLAVVLCLGVPLVIIALAKFY